MSLHYCSLDDIQTVLQASSRFDEMFDTTRRAVTGLIDTYIRRDLRYSDNVTERFDAVSLPAGQPYYIYLSKKNIETVTLTYNGRAIALDLTDDELAQGKITLIGPTRFLKNGIVATYAGGYKAVRANDEDKDYMDCPDVLRQAAVQQSAWMLNSLINNDGGSKDSDRGRQSAPKEQTVGGLIKPVAAMLSPFRRPLMRVV